MSTGDEEHEHEHERGGWTAEIPRLEQLPVRPRAVVLHWTAGTHRSSVLERASYHYLVEHLDGGTPDPADDRVRVVGGVPVERNLGRDLGGLPTAKQDAKCGYAAHTRAANSGTVGVALCGMKDAWDYRGERGRGSVDPGSAPITRRQVRAALLLCSSLCQAWGLDPGNEDQLWTHWEAEHVHEIDQFPIGEGSWRWDVTWIPGLDLGPHEEYGRWIRDQVATFGGEDRRIDW